MLNHILTESKLNEKFSNIALKAIVAEAFINSLPFDEKDLTSENVKELTNYSDTVVESLGGYTVFKNSVPTCQLGKDILDVCNEAAVAASKRVTTDEKTGVNATKNLPEVVDNAAFTDAEKNSLIKNADTLNMDKVSAIIQKKVINVIRSEKESYEKEKEMNDQLKDALNTDDDSSKSLESLMDVVLNKTDPRKYISLFSKLNDVYYDAVSHTTESYTEIPFKTLSAVTFESTLNDFKRNSSIETCLESLNLFTQSVNDNHDIGNTALLCSVVTYTAIEALNTMGFFKPNAPEVQKFIDNSQSFANKPVDTTANLKSTLVTKLADIKKACTLTNNTRELTSYYDTLTRIKERVDGVTNEAITPIKSELSSVIDPTVKFVGDKIATICNASKSQYEMSDYDKRQKDATVAQFNKINGLYGNNPNVSTITLQMNPTDPSVIDVTCKDTGGNPVGQSFMDVQYKSAFGSATNYVKESYVASKLSQTNKKVSIYLTNGSGKYIDL